MAFYIRKSNIRLCIFVIFLLVYLTLGAFIFSLIERPLEDVLKSNIRKSRMEFLDINKCISGMLNFSQILLHTMHALCQTL